ncbi:S1C family serine protease [Haloferula chungangensis]|uniref:S1C family serine protease n=1 Tax=Haloferula chungangensis TaxID=1048331 RepID=A0ABW2L1Y6_9BACT
MKASLVLFALGATSLLPAQDVPLQRPEERMETRRQSAEIYEAVRPVARKVSASTVWVWVKGRQVAIGTVVGDGTQVLTKWSEIGINYDSIQVVGGDGRQANATVLGVYQDEDIAMLQLEGARFTPITWSVEETPPVGRFLVAAGPDDNPLRVGVVAVSERILRETDQAFIGVELKGGHEGEGVLVGNVMEDGGAKMAGVKAGDVILELGGVKVDSAFELRAVLLNHEPGAKLGMKVLRGGKELELQVELKGRPEFPQLPQARLNVMRAMGGPLSVVGSGFPTVIQTDMQLKPNQCGGPVVDLKGNVIGMTISRTDRTRSYILPASDVAAILGKESTSPELAEIPGRNDQQLTMRQNQSRPRAVPMNPGSADRLRRHLEEMQSLLERMDLEMGGIGE